MMKLQSFREATAEYESDARAGQERLADAERLVSELQAEISKAVPGVDYSVIRLGPADYRMYAFVETETEREAVEEALGSRTVDILCEHDIWIVVIILLREQASA